MDNLTHSLVGALLGQTGLKKKTGLAMPALIIGANLPDVDAACFFWLEGQEHLGFRRGITHGPPALVLLPLILAGLLWGFDRWQEKRGKRPEGRRPVNFKWLFLLSFIGCLTHPALDWLNVYGIRLLEPFSSQWFYGDTLFIIDVWLWALMGFAVWFSLRREKQGGDWQKPAWIASVAALAYIGVNWLYSESIKYFSGSDISVRAEVVPSPPPVEFWKRDVIYRDPASGQWTVIHHSLVGAIQDAKPVSVKPKCVVPQFSWGSPLTNEVSAFQFWSRAPFAERAEDGSVLLRDARFYDPLARDRFTVELPDEQCIPLGEEPTAD